MKTLARNLGLSPTEWHSIVDRLGREPSIEELGVFSAMFSEHCSYKSSKRFLKRFPTRSSRVLQGPGENAGVVALDATWALAFKIESHNHPSFIEPVQGAATGVGGILRDIFAMGARPIAVLDCLFFGLPESPRWNSLLSGVVRGISHYGNAFGVANLGGSTFFHPTYSANPLVNAFALGLVRRDRIFRATAAAGDWVVYVGAPTGKDGVHGAKMASQEFSSEAALERPTVQVGDPFAGKRLLEATLSVLEQNLVTGLQDMGAAGLTSSTFEIAERSGLGMELDLSRVPLREPGLSAMEILLSESQERMLFIVPPPQFEKVQALFQKADLHCVKIGEVQASPRMVAHFGGKKVLDLDPNWTTEVPEPIREGHAPSDLPQRFFLDRNRLLSISLPEKIRMLLTNPNLLEKHWIWEQYDSQVGNRTEQGPGFPAGVLQPLPGEGEARLVTAAAHSSRVGWLDPEESGRRSVAAAVLKVALEGARPLALTNCLNFGSPENPEVLWQLDEATRGMAEAAQGLDCPVISGNVSLFNETDGKPILPTPVVVAVGTAPLKLRRLPKAPWSTDLELAIAGTLSASLGGSEFVFSWLGRDAGRPQKTEIPLALRLSRWAIDLHERRLPLSLELLGKGGLLGGILGWCLRSPILEMGLTLQLPAGTEEDELLFGEGFPRVLVACEQGDRTELERITQQAGVPLSWIGNTTDKGLLELRKGYAPLHTQPLEPLRLDWQRGLADRLA